ncbi:clp1-like protein [Moniliophthora roreri]|uniref:Putative Clp1 n=1 Tax=Moniliophthora roreri TaxID=221103 RepID=A0A0W0F0U9_MONRR|nr:clp1-like protein [Moniliophthora roreri]
MLRNSNHSKRISSHSENLPPSTKLSSHRFNPIAASRRQRRVRTNGGAAIHSKYNVEQARRRALKQPVRFEVACAPVVRPATEETSKPKFTAPAQVPVVLPRALSQPSYVEVPEENLCAAFGSTYNGAHPQFCREIFKEFGPGMLKTVISVTAEVPKNKLPKEMEVFVHDPNVLELPSHMLAVYGTTPSAAPNSKIDVKLYPVHANLLASHCAKLSPFEPSPVALEPENPMMTLGTGEPIKKTLPVRSIRLPSPQTFPKLSQYLYTQRAEILYDAFLPTPASKFINAFNAAGTTEPSTSREDTESATSFFTHPQNMNRQLEFAQELARTYTAHTMLEKLAVIHGVWMNACALGVFDEPMWAIIDGCYEVLIRALAMGSGVDLDAQEN